jgi:hypothetical protein
VAHETDFGTVDADAFEERMRPLAHHVANVGLFFWGPSTNAYVLSVFALAGVALAAAGSALVLLALTGLDVAAAIALAAAAVLTALALWWFGRRSVVVDRALARTHFRSPDGLTPLTAVGRSVDHVFCATELQSGGHVYLSPKFIYGYPFGLGTPGALTLSTAVQASACLPGAFAARRLPTAPHEFADGDIAAVPTELVLTDGGVYDNMADQWFTGLADRLRRHADLPLASASIDELVVANASAGHPWRELRRARIPLVAELATLQRVNSVMYEVTTRRRRKHLVDDWERALSTGDGMRGALVHIAQSPHGVADFYRDDATDGRDERARAAIALLGDEDAGRTVWRARANDSSAVKTVLRKLDGPPSVALLEHAYVLAMCNLHVLLGYPLLELPRQDRFERLIAHAAAAPRGVAAYA